MVEISNQFQQHQQPIHTRVRTNQKGESWKTLYFVYEKLFGKSS